MSNNESSPPAPAPTSKSPPCDKLTPYMSHVNLSFETYGVQDQYLDGKYQSEYMTVYSSLIYDAPATFLAGRHRFIYKRIGTENKWVKSQRWAQNQMHDTMCLRMKISTDPAQCDFINTVDLIIDGEHELYSVETEIAGMRTDILFRPHLTSAINATLFNGSESQCPKTVPGKTVIPLVMAPFYKNNLIKARGIWHEILVVVKFMEPSLSTLPKTELWGNLAFCPTGYQLADSGYRMITYQTECTGAEILKKGANRFKLHFNHPCHVIYVIGLDKSKVTNIKLLLSNDDKDVAYMDCTMEQLEYSKRHDLDAIVLYLCREPFFEKSMSTLNFSRIDNPYLTITTEQDDEPEIHINSIHSMPLVYNDGLYGYVFAS